MEQSCVGHRIENAARQRMLRCRAGGAAGVEASMPGRWRGSDAGQVVRQGGFDARLAPGI